MAAVVLDVAALRRGEASLPNRATSSCTTRSAGPSASPSPRSSARAVLVTQDHIAGNELSRSGDLAPANVRLARAGVRIERRAAVVRVDPRGVTVGDRFTGIERVLPCVALVDCGFRLPTEPLPGATSAAGDCVAPRTVHEAILEGRRAALAL